MRIILILCCSICGALKAQAQYVLNIDAAAIRSNTVKSNTQDVIVAWNSNWHGSNITGYIILNVAPQAPNMSSSINSFPISALSMTSSSSSQANSGAYSIGSDLNIWEKGTNDLFSGQETVNLSITIPNLNSYSWLPGVYTGKLNYKEKTRNFTSFASPKVSPSSSDVTVNIDAFVIPSINKTSINLIIDDLSYYRSGYNSATKGTGATITVIHNIPYTLGVAYTTSTGNFSYTGTKGASQLIYPEISTSLIRSSGEVGLPATLIRGHGYNAVESVTIIPAGNTTVDNIDFYVSTGAMKSNFFRAGTYTGMIELPITSTTQANKSLNNINLIFTVSELASITTGQSNVDLSFTNVADYKNGVSKTVPGQLVVSDNVPFDLTVKSSSAFF